MLCGAWHISGGGHRCFVAQIEAMASEAFLWEVVLVLRPELGGCERVGLIWTVLGLGETESKVFCGAEQRVA